MAFFIFISNPYLIPHTPYLYLDFAYTALSKSYPINPHTKLKTNATIGFIKAIAMIAVLQTNPIFSFLVVLLI